MDGQVWWCWWWSLDDLWWLVKLFVGINGGAQELWWSRWLWSMKIIDDIVTPDDILTNSHQAIRRFLEVIHLVEVELENPEEISRKWYFLCLVNIISSLKYFVVWVIYAFSKCAKQKQKNLGKWVHFWSLRVPKAINKAQTPAKAKGNKQVWKMPK